jgi:hypothetical protein
MMRRFNEELDDTANHQYSYNFDMDIMHPYMIRAMKAFLKSGRTMEMGSYKGSFTKLLKKMSMS